MWGKDEKGTNAKVGYVKLTYGRFGSLGHAGRKGGDSVSAEDRELRVVSTRENTTEEYSFDALAKGLARAALSHGAKR